MNADLEHLIVLQAQDLELARLRAELAEAPRRVAQAEITLRNAQSALKGCREALATEDKLRRSQESDVATQRTKLERLRRSLNAATSAAQVSAFEHEIAFGEAAIRSTEDEEFASMERTEMLEPQQVDSQATMETAAAQLEAERARAARVKESNDAAVTGLERERTALRPQISDRWLAVYDRLTKGKGTAVAEALGNATSGKCSACQMTVRPQRWQDLIGREHDEEIFVCESCGRLLFWDPRRDTPKPWAPGERLEAARRAAEARAPAASGAGR